MATPSSSVALYHQYKRSTEIDREDLISESGYSIDDREDLEDMGELSDSYSSEASHPHSRPITPRRTPLNHSKRLPTTSPSLSTSSDDNHNMMTSPEIFTLAHKAEKILGLVPGTLPHAKACLENARDEVRRTASETLHHVTNINNPYESNGSLTYDYRSDHGVNGKAHMSRARKAMSLVIPGANHSAKFGVPSVVVGHGGEEEEIARERRRKAVDGVLYWQKEVARLEHEGMDTGVMIVGNTTPGQVRSSELHSHATHGLGINLGRMGTVKTK